MISYSVDALPWQHQKRNTTAANYQAPDGRFLLKNCDGPVPDLDLQDRLASSWRLADNVLSAASLSLMRLVLF